MSNGAPPPIKVWIFRKQNGQLRVDPSPVILAQSERFRIANVAEAEASVQIDQSIVKGPARIPNGGTEGCKELVFEVVAKGPRYFEYEVTVDGDYADGGSKPGGIIDP